MQHVTLRDELSDYQLCPKTQGRATRVACQGCSNMKGNQIGTDIRGVFRVFFCDYKDMQEVRKNAGD